MDFIERFFGVSPDGGNGVLELIYFVVIVGAIMTLIFRRQIARFTVGLWLRKRGN
jgi:hypothetical protein